MDIRGERIDVTAYAGYRGEEAPRAMVLRGRTIAVVRILDRWIEEEGGTKGRRRCFTLEGSDGMTHSLCYDEDEQEWHYRGFKAKRHRRSAGTCRIPGRFAPSLLHQADDDQGKGNHDQNNESDN